MKTNSIIFLLFSRKFNFSMVFRDLNDTFMNDLRKFDGECPTINRYGDGETKCSRYVSTRVRYITRSRG